jgi:hypothetical protein
MRAMRLLPKSSRLRLSPTDDHPDQTSESDAHGGGHGVDAIAHGGGAADVPNCAGPGDVTGDGPTNNDAGNRGDGVDTGAFGLWS